MAKPLEISVAPLSSGDITISGSEPTPRVLSIQLKDGVAFLPDVGEGQTTITYEADEKVRAKEVKPWRKTLQMSVAPYWSGVLVQYETAQKVRVSAVIPFGHIKCVRLAP